VFSSVYGAFLHVALQQGAKVFSACSVTARRRLSARRVTAGRQGSSQQTYWVKGFVIGGKGGTGGSRSRNIYGAFLHVALQQGVKVHPPKRFRVQGLVFRVALQQGVKFHEPCTRAFLHVALQQGVKVHPNKRIDAFVRPGVELRATLKSISH